MNYKTELIDIPFLCAATNICGTSVLSATQITMFAFSSDSHGRISFIEIDQNSL